MYYLMRFKNVLSYRLTQPISITDSQLSQLKARPPSTQEMSSVGFTGVLDDDADFIQSYNGVTVVRLLSYDKKIPGALIKYELGKRIRSVEKTKKEPVGKKMRAQLKQEVVSELCRVTKPTPKYTTVFVYSDQRIILVANSSSKVAETCLAMIRKAIGSLPCAPLAPFSVTQDLTNWVFKQSPEQLLVKHKAKLTHPDGVSGSTSLSKQDMDAEDVIAAFQVGKTVNEIELEFNASVTFKLTDDFIVKGIAYHEGILDDIATESTDEMGVQDALLSMEVEQLLELYLFLVDTLSLEI